MANETNNEQVFDALINFSTQGDDTALTQAEAIDDVLDSLREGADITLDITTQGDESIDDIVDQIDRINSETITPTVEADDSSLLEADRLLDKIDTTEATPEIDVDKSGVDEASSALDTIKNLAVINTIWNIGGTILDFAGKGVDFLASPILEYDTALSKVQARTGAMIPNARELISDLYTDGWGESRDQIADVVVLADQLGISQDKLADATRTAFETSAVTGDDVNATLRTMDNLVKTGLVPDYTAAGDIIVAGFQEGDNRAGDLQDALVEFGPKFASMRISGEGALAIIHSGLENGAKSASLVADGIKELGTNLSKIGSDENVTNAFNQLDSLSDIDLSGLLDAYNEGKITGDQFYQGIFDALNDATASDPQAAQQIGATLIGSKSEDLGVGVFANLSTEFDTTAGEIEGRAEEAGETIHDNLTSQFTEVTRSIQDKIAEYFENSTDFDTFLENVKTGVADLLDTLKGGGSLDDALTVGLKPLGFDDEFQKLESIFGNLVIQMLQIVAGIQEATGNGKAASATRDQISQLGARQLGFDLKVNNPDEILSTIQTAVDRGVDPETIANSAATAVSELVKNGAVDQAQSLVDALNKGGQVRFNIADAGEAALFKQFTGLDSTEFTVPVSPEMTPEDIQNFIQEQKDAFKGNGINSLTADVVPVIDTTELQAQITDATREATGKALVGSAGERGATGTGFLSPTQFGLGAAGGNTAASLTGADLAGKNNEQVGAALAGVNQALEDQKTKAAETKEQLDALSQTTADYSTAIDNAAAVNSGAVGTFGEMVAAAAAMDDTTTDAFNNVGDSATEADENVTNAISGNSMIPEIEKLRRAAETELPLTVNALEALDAVRFDGIEARIRQLVSYFGSLKASAESALISAAAANAAASGSGGGGSNNTTTNNDNSTNTINVNTQTPTQAIAAAEAAADSLRTGL